jgi:hypothetical protein
MKYQNTKNKRHQCNKSPSKETAGMFGKNAFRVSPEACLCMGRGSQRILVKFKMEIVLILLTGTWHDLKLKP